MNELSYPFVTKNDGMTFEFDSISSTKVVRKIIEYHLIDEELSIYNLALVDSLPNNQFSDLNISNNRDMPKVLATVFQSILRFFELKPSARILIEGSTPARTRLYQMAISKYLIEFKQQYVILGLSESGSELFEKGKTYDRFIVSLK